LIERRNPSPRFRIRRGEGGHFAKHVDRPDLFQEREGRVEAFSDLLRDKFDEVKRHVRKKFGFHDRKSDADSSNTSKFGLNDLESFELLAYKFLIRLDESAAAVAKGQSDNEATYLYERLRQMFVDGGIFPLISELQFQFTSHILLSRVPEGMEKAPSGSADLRYPHEWFPATRALQRKIHLHVGPTNSVKTYNALKRLEEAESGIYAGPLRLLAHEVYSRLNAKGKTCALITGEERRIPENQEFPMSSCTVEMIPLNTDVDVAVIDEIQMLGDRWRGWAWTSAFLGVKAKEVHLCGELRTVPLIKELCAMIGDDLEIHEYQRLSPLKAMTKSLRGDLTKLEKGDCVILFSRVAIHKMKKQIEQKTGKRCAIVYGSLPPETRAQQAALFNDPNNDYDILVASDAVGMGLNLSIKRVIFEATSKHDGSEFKTLTYSELKQIAGRAGRYKTASQAILDGVTPGSDGSILIPDDAQAPQKQEQAVGLVTTLDDIDLPIVHRALNNEVEPLTSAGIIPPANVIQQFASYFPAETPLSWLLLRLNEISLMNPRFELCKYNDQLSIADIIQDEQLTLADRLTFIAAPSSLKDKGMTAAVKMFAKAVAEQTSGELLNFKEIDLEALDEPDGDPYSLTRLEALHKVLTLYLWLSYRFAGVFKTQKLAFHVKGLVEVKIDKALDSIEYHTQTQEAIKRLKQKAALEDLKRENLRQREAAEAKSPMTFEIEDDQEPLLDYPGEERVLGGDDEGVVEKGEEKECNNDDEEGMVGEEKSDNKDFDDEMEDKKEDTPTIKGEDVASHFAKILEDELKKRRNEDEGFESEEPKK
jgi:ATP-dependent RNA helicase SUPV3L1/SUV3